MAKAFASQSLIGCQLSRHGAASVVQPKQWRASLVSFKPKSVFLEENRCKVIRWSLAGALALGLSLAGSGFADAKIGVNKPYLLPKEFSPVIDVAGFLSPGQESRLIQKIADIERNTGYKLEYWHKITQTHQVDERTIVFVADPTFGNILHFNVGELVDANVPHNFWSRVSGKYGNMFYWKEKGEDSSIEAAVTAISTCLKEPNATNCSEINL